MGRSDLWVQPAIGQRLDYRTAVAFTAGQELGRQTTSDLVYHHLRQAIHEGRFKPGERLDLNGIAEKLGTSRMPVREALIRLQIEGFVNISPYRCANIVQLSHSQLSEIYDVRLALEGMAARRAAENISEEHLNRLHTILDNMKRSLDSDHGGEYPALNRRMHWTIFEVAGNGILTGMISILWDKAELYRNRFLLMPQRTPMSFDEHRLILEALEARDGVRAQEAMERHLANAKSALLAQGKEEA